MKSAFLALVMVAPVLAGEADYTVKMAPTDRWEIRVDIDHDGIVDTIVSEPVGGFGTMGGSWDVYLGRKDGGFQRVGEIWAHPLALRIERQGDQIRFWVYLKSGGSTGSLGYFTLQKGAIGPLQKIEIFPGDGGTTLGNSLYQAIFSPEARCVATKKKA
jgi:hypothetical protein